MAKVTRGPAISSQRTRQDPRSEGDQIFLTPEQLDRECKLYPFQKLLLPAQLLPNLCIVLEFGQRFFMGWGTQNSTDLQRHGNSVSNWVQHCSLHICLGSQVSALDTGNSVTRHLGQSQCKLVSLLLQEL